MIDLYNTFQGNDLGFLRIVAERWGIEFNAPDAFKGLSILIEGMTNPELFLEMIESLPQDSRAAIQNLRKSDNIIPWAQFSRNYGSLREMGAAKRDRERPDLSPENTTEILFYRGLIGKAFLNLDEEVVQEYAYIPQELYSFLSPNSENEQTLLGRPSSPKEHHFKLPANSRILDHACTMLAGLRLGLSSEEINPFLDDFPQNILRQFLLAAGLLNHNHQPNPEQIKKFLGQKRSTALAFLTRNWLDSTVFNDLHLIPELRIEGEWMNDPLKTRQRVIEFLSGTPQDNWWNIQSIISSIKEQYPDFQRPAGDYDSWYMYDEETQTYLRGFSSWNQVDGRLIEFLITGPLHWLGILDLASPSPSQKPAAFHPSKYAEALWHRSEPANFPEINAEIRISPTGEITFPSAASRVIRYQIARFCSWLPNEKTTYKYQITPNSLSRASEQGLKPNQLIHLMKSSFKPPIPPNLIKSLENWEKHGIQAEIEDEVLLRFSIPEILNAIQKTPANHFIVEQLNESVVIIKSEGIENIQEELIRAGYLPGIDISFTI
ncbi:MAG: hypothetical protein JEZ06_10545 [Anaerolineaceae bacterium]|nr:hypothetical protein [Anaerolineaceae bacterium]